jgi:hypothetical protein
LVIAAFQLTDRFQFSKPSRDPRVEEAGSARWAVVESCLQRRNQTFRDWHGPPTSVRFRITLDEFASDLGDRAADPNAPGLDIDIFYVQSGQLAEPQAGIGQDQHDVALSPTGVR